MHTIKRILLYLIIPTATHPWNIPGSNAVMNIYSKISPLITAASKSESTENDPVSLYRDRSALIAGFSAGCSIFASNKAMETNYIQELLQKIPPPKNPRLHSIPTLFFSTTIGVVVFQTLYLSGMAAHRRMNKP